MCDCIEQINAKLVNVGNTQLDIPIVFSTNALETRGVVIATRKRDKTKRQKPSRIFASYCPFCGEQYNKSVNATADPTQSAQD